ncbi:MAG: DedA family protein [Anaerolineales bacterium]
MEIISNLIDLFLHIDVYLDVLIDFFGPWSYAILFAIIFMETGFVITPFLPGDSLLFAVGAFSARGSLNVVVIFIVLFFAAVIGDGVNYWIGHSVGPRVFEKDYRFLKRAHLVKTQEFYEKHGGKTIVLARFIPIVRTFAPFVAGVGTMEYKRFIGYNIIGAFLWTSMFIFLGYFFGNIPIVQENFELLVVGIILISILPMIIEFLRNRLRKRSVSSTPEPISSEGP